MLKANPGPRMESNRDPVKLCQETQLVAMSVKTVSDKKELEGLVVQGHLKARSLFQPPVPLSDPPVHLLPQMQSLPQQRNQIPELSKREKVVFLIGTIPVCQRKLPHLGSACGPDGPSKWQPVGRPRGQHSAWPDFTAVC